MSSRAFAKESNDPGPQRAAEDQVRKASDQGAPDLMDADGSLASSNLLPVSQLVDANAPPSPGVEMGNKRLTVALASTGQQTTNQTTQTGLYNYGCFELEHANRPN